MHRLLVLLAALLGALGVLVAPQAASAHLAQPYPLEPTATVSDSTVSAGGAVTFSGRGAANEVLTIRVRYSDGTTVTLGTVTADADGFWSFNARLTRAGTATLTATGPISGTVSQDVTVAATGVTLARTGEDKSEVPTIVLSGAAAVLLGSVLIFGALVWRRRSARTGAQ